MRWMISFPPLTKLWGHVLYSRHCELPQGLHLGWNLLLRKMSNWSSGVYHDDDCVTHIKLKWNDGILLNGDCVVGAPECLGGTDYKVKNCVSFNILECSEEGDNADCGENGFWKATTVL